MRTKPGNEPRQIQINIRLTITEAAALDNIGLREDRERAYLVAWFTRWGLQHYQETASSLVELQNSKIITAAAQALVEKEINKVTAAKSRRAAKHTHGKTNPSKAAKKQATAA